MVQSSADTFNSIPRFQHLDYLRIGLQSVREGDDLDAIRIRLREASLDLSKRQYQGGEQLLVMDPFTGWSGATQVCRSLMQMRLIKSEKLPSKRATFDEHRDRKFTLTAAGSEFLADIQDRYDLFIMNITPKLLEHYSAFYGFLKMLHHHPVYIPEYTEDDLATYQNLGTDWLRALATDASQRLASYDGSEVQDVNAVTDVLRDGLNKRFGSSTQPSRKDQLATLHDAFIALVTERRGYRMDAVTWDILRSWGDSLFVSCESRYVRDFPGGRLTWITVDADLDGPTRTIERRGLSKFGDRVAAQLPLSYRALADVANTRVRYPLLEIFRVRATTAFKVGVNSQIVNKVIAEIWDEQRPADYRIDLSMGSARWSATSEQPFKINKERYYTMLVKPEGE